MSKCWICGKEMTKTIGGCEHCKDCGTGYNDLVFRLQNETIIYHNKIVDNGTAIHLTCDCCGREIFGCTFVNSMKFCAKCYQETFGNNASKFVDLLNTEMYELKISNLEYKLNEKRQQIAELQKQLKSQPAEIVEKIKEQIFNHFNVKNIEEYERLSLPNALFTADAAAEILDTILKDYQK